MAGRPHDDSCGELSDANRINEPRTARDSDRQITGGGAWSTQGLSFALCYTVLSNARTFLPFAESSSLPVPNDVVHLLVALTQIYSFILLARIILSWIPNVDRSNQIVQLLYQLTEPVLEPVRRTIPPLGMIDLSPIIVFIGLRILQSVLLGMATGY